MSKQEWLERLYELMQLEEQRLENEKQWAEKIKEKENLETELATLTAQLRQRHDRLLSIGLALFLSYLLCALLFINPIIQLTMFIIFTFLLYIFFRKALHFLKRKKPINRNILSAKKRRLIEELQDNIEEREQEITNCEEKDKELKGKINKTAEFLPSSYHNERSFRQLYEYLFYDQAETLRDAFYLYEQKMRHEEKMNIQQEIRTDQRLMNEQLLLRVAKLEEENAKLEKEIEELKEQVSKLSS